MSLGHWLQLSLWLILSWNYLKNYYPTHCFLSWVLNVLIHNLSPHLFPSWSFFANELVRHEVMPEIKDNIYNDLSPMRSGVTLTTCSEDASKSGEKALKVSL